MPDSLRNFLLAHENLWILQVFGVVLGTALVALAMRGLLRFLQARFSKTRTLWDDAAIIAARKPLQALIWVLGLNVASRVIVRETGSDLFQHAGEVRELLLIAIGAWFLLRFIREAEYALTHPTDGLPGVDVTSSKAIAKLLRITVIITAVLMLLQKLGYSISGVLAFGGIGGIAVGFAAKDLLANFFGGLMIYLDRPFSIGDWVRSPDRNIEGTVEQIGWRLTRIRTFDKRPLYVPNATFTSIAVENPSRMTHRRINETIGVRYDDWQKLPAIVGEVREMLEAHPGIDQDETLIVNFTTFNQSSLDFFIYTFTRTRDWIEYHHVKQDVLFRIMNIVTRHGAELAFPTRTLHIATQPGAEEAARPALPAATDAPAR